MVHIFGSDNQATQKQTLESQPRVRIIQSKTTKGCHHFSLHVYIGFLFVFHLIAGPELDAGANDHSPSTGQGEGVGKEEGHKREGKNLDIIYR